ncbi:MAG: type II toxin-antitoxin system VapC family toxin [Legionella sp.]|uniref:type II toxin-antitoxin system VapC family toxin n=1 Tax=Legionella sp. TaxID=459 RepID=UPI0039E65849
MSYLLDTNVISELVKPTPNERVLRWIDGINSDQLYLSVISIGEIRKGVAKILDPRRQEKISQWLEVELPDYFEERILNINLTIADMWGQLQSKNKGYMLPAIDGLIAATAQVHNLTLVTRNTKDFNQVSINIINPWEIDPDL